MRTVARTLIKYRAWRCFHNARRKKEQILNRVSLYNEGEANKKKINKLSAI